MPIPKSPMAALSLALAIAIPSTAAAAETEQLTFNGKPSTVVCAVLHLCDVELQPGEVITDLQVGDRARWSITPAITNIGSTEVHHLVIRPFDVGLETSAVVATNRRTYHLQLRSDASRYMPRVKFSYPEEAQRKLEDKVAKELHARQRGLIPETNQYLGDLDFKYRLNGAAALKPLRVYNDHLKTTIELPPAAGQGAPTLLVTEAGRGGDKAMAYKRQGSFLIVDGLFDAAVLVYGKGGDKGTVSIDRLQKTGLGQAGAITAAPVIPRSNVTAATATAAPSQPPFTASVRQGEVSPAAPAIPVKPSARPSLLPVAPVAKVTPGTPAPSVNVPPEKVTPAADRSAPGVTPAQVQSTPSLASKPAFVPAPRQEVWEAHKGSTLHETVLAWSKRAKWDMNWIPKDLDYPIEAPLRFEGSFEEAIAWIFPLYDKAERSFQVGGSRPQHRLTITEKSKRNPQ